MIKVRHMRIALLLTLAVSSTSLFAQVQLMRLTAGLFKVAGDVATNIPAACLQRHGRIPEQNDNYTAFSGSVQVRRTENGSTQILPIDEALNRWIKIHGNGDFHGLTVEPLHPSKGVSFEVEVASGKPAVAALKKVDLAGFPLNNHNLEYQEIDAFSSKLGSLIGLDSPLWDDWADLRAQLEWNLAESAKPQLVRSTIHNFVSENFASLNTRERLELLSLNSGRIFTPAEIARAQRFLGYTLSTQYNAGFRRDFPEYSEIVGRLSTLPGMEILSDFKSSVIGSISLGLDTSQAIANGKSSLLGNVDLDGREGAANLLRLKFAQPFTAEHISTLAEVTGKNLSKNPDRFSNSVLISMEEDGVRITSASGKAENFSSDELNPRTIRKLVSKESHAFLQGALSDDVAEALYDNHVYFLEDFDSFVRSQETKKKPRLVFIGSKNTEVAEQLYGEENAAAQVVKAAQQVEQMGGIIVENRDDLTNALKGMGSDEYPFIVFHNDVYEGILFEKPMPIYELQSMFPDNVIISCSTFASKITTTITTGRLSLRRVIRAWQSTQASVGPEPILVSEFVQAFSENYSNPGKRTSTENDGSNPTDSAEESVALDDTTRVLVIKHGSRLYGYMIPPDDCDFNPNLEKCKVREEKN